MGEEVVGACGELGVFSWWTQSGVWIGFKFQFFHFLAA